MSDWVIYLFLIIAILLIIGFFNNRSEAIAEEIRQTKVIKVHFAQIWRPSVMGVRERDFDEISQN